VVAHQLQLRDLIERRFERRQLFARDRTQPDSAPLLRIERGQALELRPRCKDGQLVCPYPGCPDPRLTTAAGSKRDHFRHLRRAPDVEHSPESYYHFVGKHLVADWLRSRGAEVEVRVEARLPTQQRPDVLATFPDGQRLAFEVQYAGLTFEQWQRRDEGYREQGIECVWLFGHLPRYLRKARGEEHGSLCHLGALQVALEKEGRRIRWLFPDERLIGTRLVETMAPVFEHDWAEVGLDGLEDCTIDDGPFRTPAEGREMTAASERERLGQKTRLAALRERRERIALYKRQEEERKAKRAEQRAREEARRLERGEVAAETSEPWRPAPSVHPAARPHRSQPQLAGPLPQLASPTADPDHVLRIVRQLFDEQRGKTLSVKEGMALARQRGVDVGAFVDALMTLSREGLVAWSPRSLSSGRIFPKN
jgi:hypothetical protein